MDVWQCLKYVPDSYMGQQRQLNEEDNLLYTDIFRSESHIDLGTQSPAGGEAITNDVLKFRKVTEFKSSCIIICKFLVWYVNSRIIIR